MTCTSIIITTGSERAKYE